MFKKHYESYHQKKYIVLPTKVRDKQSNTPFFEGWTNYSKQSPTIQMYKAWSETKNDGICLLPGKKSNVVVVDIDTNDIDIQEKIINAVGDSPVKKFGSKGVSLFFKYNGEKNFSIPDVMDLLSDGKCCTLPPSKHAKTNKNYIWLTSPLYEFDSNDLPGIKTKGLEKYLCGILNLSKSKNCQGHKFLNKSVGRNNTLLEYVSAKFIQDNKNLETIINEIIQDDLKLHPDNPLFEDEKEIRGGSPEIRAFTFVSNIQKSLIKSGKLKIKKENKVKIIDIKEIEEEFKDLTYKTKSIPKLNGLMQDIFMDCYNNSPVPRSQFSFASAISIFSTLIGNKFYFKRTHPNLFVMILAPSGFGKDFPIKYPTYLFNACGLNNLIGLNKPSSDSIVLKTLDYKKERIDIIDEASGLFAQMSDSKNTFNSNLANVYQDLYTSAGSYFLGKQAMSYITKKNPSGVIGECNRPYVNLFCSMTIEDFEKFFTGNLMNKGLGGRFFYFIDNEQKDSCLTNEYELPEDLKDNILKVYNKVSFDHLNGYDIPVKYKRIDDKLNDIRMEFDALKYEYMNTSYSAVVNRMFVFFLKLMTLDAISCQYNKNLYDIKIYQSNLDWAYEFIFSYFDNMKAFLSNHLNNENRDEKLIKLIEKTIFLSGPNGVSKNKLARNYKIKSLLPLAQKRDYYLSSMLDDCIIYQIQKDERSKVFIHSDFIEESK